MRAAAIYSRKSKFTGKGESVENQIQLCRDYALSNLSIKEFFIYEDEGFSGKDINRPEFQRMLKDAASKKFDVIICYRLDRISRNVADFSVLINRLQNLNIEFVSLREQFDTSTPMGRAMMHIAAVFAQLERETIAERIKDNMLELSKTGRWLGGNAPTGFKSTEETYYDSNMIERKKYILSPVESEIEKVQRIYSDFLESGSLSKLEEYCLQNNIKTKNKRNFSRSSLKIILSNPVYSEADELFYNYCLSKNMIISDSKEAFNGESGVIAYNKNLEKKGKRNSIKDTSEWVISLGNHKGIIPSSDWIRVQELLSAKHPKPPRLGTSKYALLNTILFCGSCGSRMRASAKYKDGEIRSFYYKCTLKEQSHGEKCSLPNLNGVDAQEKILEEIETLPIKEDMLVKELKKLEISGAYFKDKQLKRIKSLENSIESLTLMLSEAGDSNASKHIISQIERLDSEMSTLNTKVGSYEAAETGIFLDETKSLSIKDLTLDDKKKLIQGIVKKIVWDGEYLVIEFFEE